MQSVLASRGSHLSQCDKHLALLDPNWNNAEARALGVDAPTSTQLEAATVPWTHQGSLCEFRRVKRKGCAWALIAVGVEFAAAEVGHQNACLAQLD